MSEALAKGKSVVTDRRPKAAEVLEALMLQFQALAQHYGPGSVGAPNPHADADEYKLWSARALQAAKCLAPFQAGAKRAVP
jgi:hypothetical protein